MRKETKNAWGHLAQQCIWHSQRRDEHCCKSPLLKTPFFLALEQKSAKERKSVRIANSQRKRDDNKNKICTFQGGVGRGAGRKIVQNAIFHGKRHDNKILKVKILLSRNFVVMAQAPKQPDLKQPGLGTPNLKP